MPAAKDLGARAHKHGLLVHPYTFRDDSTVLPQAWKGQPQLEYTHFFDHENIDGAFTDYPGTLAAVLAQRKAQQHRLQNVRLLLLVRGMLC